MIDHLLISQALLGDVVSVDSDVSGLASIGGNPKDLRVEEPRGSLGPGANPGGAGESTEVDAHHHEDGVAQILERWL